MLLLKNCRIYDRLDSGRVSILIDGGKIKSVFASDMVGSFEDVCTIDCKERIVTPGFVDIHIQGAGGCDFLDNRVESIKEICRTLPRFGVTGILATTVVRDDIRNHHIELIADFDVHEYGWTNILGIHLEGPFINRLKRGGISENSMKDVDIDYLKGLIEIAGGKLKMMTIAPELPGMDEVVSVLIERDVIPSLGHTDVTYAEAVRFFNMGVSHVTHVFNAMRPIHHREPGPLVGIFNSDGVTVQLICDGVHVSPVMVNFLRKMIGSDRIALISDGMPGLGCEGEGLSYNGKEYSVERGTAMYSDGTLIGTVLPVGEHARRYMEYTGCDLAEAVDTISLVPLRILGLDHRKGMIREGYDADLVLIDEEMNVYMTIIGGSIAYNKC